MYPTNSAMYPTIFAFREYKTNFPYALRESSFQKMKPASVFEKLSVYLCLYRMKIKNSVRRSTDISGF